MRVAILHLSDIHIQKDRDAILTRAQRIAAAAKGVDVSVTQYVIVLSGDIAFSGRETEYGLAQTFVQELKAVLGTRANGTIPIITVPGNHDCDFSNPEAARARLLTSFETDETGEVDASVEQLCLQVQRAYFDFRDGLTSSDLQPSSGKLYYEYALVFEGQSVLFRCLNSAWLSRHHEVPGSLNYPVELIPDGPTEHAVVVSVIHHPYNWFRPNVARQLRNRLERTSDIIMTGHEHMHTRRSHSKDTGELNDYIEAAVLQDSTNADSSGFNVLLLDLEGRQQRFIHFGWDEEKYVRTFESPDWEELQVSRLRKKANQPIAKGFSGFLNDPGVTLTHPGKGRLDLQDVFVFPDLAEVSHKLKSGVRVVPGERLLDELVVDGKVLIAGGEQSGKTSLIKKLFSSFHAKGLLPIYVDGSKLKIESPERLQKDIEQAFKEQYDNVDVEVLRQTPTSQKVLLVDDFHLLHARRRTEREVVEWMEKLAGRVFLVANDLAQHVLELVNSMGFIEAEERFHHLKLLPFGHKKRNELIERWFLMDSRIAGDDAKLAQQIVHIERTVDTVIGRNYLPAYPVFLLSILQAHESNRPVDTSASTYGYFYEIFIRAALAAKSTHHQYDIKSGYLSFLAYHVFTTGKRDFDESDWRAMHAQYVKVYALPLSFENLRNDLIEGHAIDAAEDSHRFKYGYVYYYFAASYLKDHITEETIRNQITDLSAKLHDEDAANILLFLAHLSKDPFIIDTMLANAATVFNDAQPATLDEQFSFLEGAESLAQEIAYEERDLSETRRRRLALQDDFERQIEEADTQNGDERISLREEFKETEDYLMRIGAAFRTVQILGQILKNFPGSILAERKLRLTKECYNVGLRTLGSALAMFDKHQEGTLRFIVDSLKADNPEMSRDELAIVANRTVVGLAHLATYGMITRIAHAVGSPLLTETYKELKTENTSTAVGLIHAALQLEQSHLFPQAEVTKFAKDLERRPWPLGLLRHLVVNHFHVFPVKFQTKQSVCSKLGIPYKTQQAPNPRIKLLAK